MKNSLKDFIYRTNNFFPTTKKNILYKLNRSREEKKREENFILIITIFKVKNLNLTTTTTITTKKQITKYVHLIVSQR